MTTFDDRERAEEKKFQIDQELEFKAHARRAKLVGLWAAGLLGKAGDAAEAYAKTLVAADIAEAGEEDIFRKVHKDLGDAGVAQSEHQIRAQMAELLIQARAQVRA